MADLNSGDLFAINRGGDDYKVSLGDLVRYLTAEEPFKVVSQSSWVSSNDEFVAGATCKAKTAVFAGGSALGNNFRYRWQTQESSRAWENTEWTYYDNTASEVETPTLEAGKQIKLQCQATNSSESIALQNSMSALKKVETGTLPWEGHNGGIWHIKNVENDSLALTGGPFTAWDIDSSNERQISQVNVGEELVFVTSGDCTCLFKDNKRITWEFGDFTDTSKVTNMTDMFNDANNFNADIGNWDTSNVTVMEYMFENAWSFNQYIGNWDTSSVTNMSGMLCAASSFNQDINSWDVSNVTTMKQMFYICSDFNQPLGNWDTSSVTDMTDMFNNAYDFNQDLSTKQVTVNGNTYTAWDTSNVTKMLGMFQQAPNFNGDISGWNVSNVTDMSQMFGDAEEFNQDIGSWNVAKVEDMSKMFTAAVSFNQDIGDWDTSSVKDMPAMFTAAIAFNQDIGRWDTSNVETMGGMFAGALAFDQDLSGWCVEEIESIPTSFDTQSGFAGQEDRQPQWGTCPGKEPEIPEAPDYPQPWLDLDDKTGYFEVIVTEENACTVADFTDIWNAENGQEVDSFSLHEGRSAKPERHKNNERLLAHKQAWLKKNPNQLTEEETEAFLVGDRLPKSLQSTFSYYYYYAYGTPAVTLKPGRYIISYGTMYMKLNFEDSQGDFQLGDTADFKGHIWARNFQSKGEHKNGHYINSYFTNARNFSNKGQPLPQVWRDYLERCWPKGLNGLFRETNFNEDLSDLNTFNQDPNVVIQFGNKGTDPVWGTDPKGLATKPTTPERFNMLVYEHAGGDLSVGGNIKKNTVTFKESIDWGEGSCLDYKFVSEKIKVGDEVLLSEYRIEGPEKNDYDNGTGGNIDYVCRVVDTGTVIDGYWMYAYLTLEGIDGYGDPDFEGGYQGDLYVDGWAYR